MTLVPQTYPLWALRPSTETDGDEIGLVVAGQRGEDDDHVLRPIIARLGGEADYPGIAYAEDAVIELFPTLAEARGNAAWTSQS